MPERRGRGEGSIYQRESDGRWVGVVDLGWVGGKRVRKTVTAKTKREVMPKLKALRAQIESGVLADATTVEQWMTYWLDTIAAKKVRPSTLSTYRGYVATWIVPHLGRHRLDRLRADHVRALYQAMEDSGRSDATRRQVHAILRRALVVAKREQRIVVNPAEQVDPPAVGKGSHGHLTLNEARRVLTYAARTPDVSTSRWACALLAGLRQGEALGLRWEDVDLDAGIIHVRQAAQAIRGQGVQIVELKSKTALRDVPMVGPVWEALAAEPAREGYVWPNPFQPDRPENARRDWGRWRDLLEAAGVEPRPLHAARATCASLLEAAGVSQTTVKEILGHSQISVTQRHYLHSDSTAHRQAMDDLGRLLG